MYTILFLYKKLFKNLLFNIEIDKYQVQLYAVQKK